MPDGIFHSSGLAIVAAGGGAGVITGPFQLVDQHSGTGGGGRKAIKNRGPGNPSLAGRVGEISQLLVVINEKRWPGF